MVVLKKKFTRVSKFMFNEVKKLIELMGETYIEAPCEADEVCGWLAITNQVHGCLSEDTDLFVYGCPRVYKNLDLNNFTLSKYEYNIILKQMNISSDNFTQLCVIANNDYNNNSKNLYYYYYLYKKYEKKYKNGSFYDWLMLNNHEIDYEKLVSISDKYMVSKAFEIPLDIKYKNTNKTELINFLKNYNFIFI